MGPPDRDLTLLSTARAGRGGEASGRLVLGRVGRRVVAAEPAQSVIVFGPTQSHKTSGFAVPAVLEWDGPVIAASVKTDLLEHTIGHRRSLGRVDCFDPTGSTGLESSVWSPLPSARTWPGARRAAAGLTEVVKSGAGPMTDGDFWYATATRMLAPLLFAAAVGGLGLEDVIRWVDTQEESEVLDLLAGAGVAEAVQAASSTFGKDERQRSSIYTTVETVLEPFAERRPAPGRWGRPGRDRSRPRGRRTQHALPLCSRPRPAPAHTTVRVTAAPHPRARVRPGDPHPEPPRPTVAPRARRGSQHRPAQRPRRAGRHRRRPRRATGDHLARPVPGHRPLRPPVGDGGQQPPGQALPVRHLRPRHVGARQPADRRGTRDGAGDDDGRPGRAEHHPLRLDQETGPARRPPPDPARTGCPRLRPPPAGPAEAAALVLRLPPALPGRVGG